MTHKFIKGKTLDETFWPKPYKPLKSVGSNSTMGVGPCYPIIYGFTMDLSPYKSTKYGCKLGTSSFCWVWF